MAHARELQTFSAMEFSTLGNMAARTTAAATHTPTVTARIGEQIHPKHSQHFSFLDVLAIASSHGRHGRCRVCS